MQNNLQGDLHVHSLLIPAFEQHENYYTQGGHKLRFFSRRKVQFVTVSIIYCFMKMNL
jgi:hypothetical protein